MNSNGISMADDELETLSEFMGGDTRFCSLSEALETDVADEDGCLSLEDDDEEDGGDLFTSLGLVGYSY
jgi:hypothetical protein